MNRLLRLCLVGAALALPSTPALAEIHRWVDDQGVTHFGDRPPAGTTAAAVDVEVTEPTAEDIAESLARAKADSVRLETALTRVQRLGAPSKRHRGRNRHRCWAYSCSGSSVVVISTWPGYGPRW